MKNREELELTQKFDERRSIIIPGDAKETIEFCVKQFLQIAHSSIKKNDIFTVALSGGSTPNAIFKALSQPPYRNELDWSKVLFFWSDERSVPPTHPESNYHMAMEAGLAQLPIPKDHIFRMRAEKDIEQNALKYEQDIIRNIPSKRFDLMMLGMGEDGHTASLFPHTEGLHIKDRLVIANHIPQKQTWRMSLTYECIQNAHHICIYVIGKNKSDMVAQALKGNYEPDSIPIQKIGTAHNQALWILDHEAAIKLLKLVDSN